MKTNYSKLILSFVFIAFGYLFTVHGQGLLSIGSSDDDFSDTDIPIKWDVAYQDAYDALDPRIGWAKGTFGGSAGLSWGDNDGFSETTFCVGAEYLYRISEESNPNGASYLGAFGNYHNTSSDSFDQNSFRVGLRYSYHDRISAFNRFNLIYGVKGSYEFGKRDFSNVEDDVTGINLSGFAGIGVRLCDGFSIGAELPIVTFASRTFENNGNEFKADNTWIGLNKNNPVMVYGRWHLGANRSN